MRDSVITAALLFLAGLSFGQFDRSPSPPALVQAPQPIAEVSGIASGKADPTLQAISDATAKLASQVLAATVHFEATRRTRGEGVTAGTGSGFVLDKVRGLVVTNNHVVGGRDAVVRVRLHDGREFDGLVVGTDPKTDIAVVQIPEGEADSQLAWGDSDKLVPGTWIMAVGNPLGELGTTSTGVISGLNRTPELPDIRYENFLQFDAYIDRGSSGGPLVNMAGEVIGINTAIAGQVWQGAGYAVPARMASAIVQALISDQRVRRGYLGVEPTSVSASDADQVGLSRPYGARVGKVTPESPAAKAGLVRGDIILAIEGKEVASTDDLRARISTTPPGTPVRFKIWRDGAPMTLRVTLGELAE
jgi:S1-C subfamily serine protease